MQVLWVVEAFPSINIKLLSLLIMEAVNFLQQVNEQGKTTFLSTRSESSPFEVWNSVVVSRRVRCRLSKIAWVWLRMLL